MAENKTDNLASYCGDHRRSKHGSWKQRSTTLIDTRPR